MQNFPLKSQRKEEDRIGEGLEQNKKRPLREKKVLNGGRGQN